MGRPAGSASNEKDDLQVCKNNAQFFSKKHMILRVQEVSIYQNSVNTLPIFKQIVKVLLVQEVNIRENLKTIDTLQMSFYGFACPGG